jgi:hypothetical protein
MRGTTKVTKITKADKKLKRWAGGRKAGLVPPYKLCVLRVLCGYVFFSFSFIQSAYKNSLELRIAWQKSVSG